MIRKIGLALLLGVVGAMFGYTAGAAWDKYFQNNRPMLFALLGAAIGLFCLPLWWWWLSKFKEAVVESVEIELPLIGAKLNVKLTGEQRAVGWRLFVESATRVTTQTLGPNEGIVREALTSLYKLFDLVRSELKSMPPSPVHRGQNDYTVETYAVRMLNDGLRPMLSRWHPRLAKWEMTGRPESEWPLAEECRLDLERTRQMVLAYTWGLGQMLKLRDLNNLLPPQPTGDKPEFVPLATIQSKETAFESNVSEAQRVAGWHLFVELVSRVATQPLDSESGLIREALTSLNQLFDIIRTELKTIVPRSAKGAPGQAQDDSVEALAMSILNKHLRPFLAKWHPQLTAWEKENKPEAEWPEKDNCRSELEDTRKAILAKTRKLGEIISLRSADLLLASTESSA